MTAENSIQPMDLALYVEGRFKPAVTEGISVNPVGAIIFDDNKRVVFLGVEQNGKIHAEGGDLPPDFTSDSLPGWEGRVFSLPHLKDLMVFQTLMGAVTVRAMDSVVSDKAVVSAHITTYTDAQNPKLDINKSIFLEEKELLGALRGEAGGVVAFRGIGLPEDNAFLIERKNADSRYGMLFFLRPNSLEEQGIDSLQGLYSFLLAVNTAFKEQSPLPFQTESLALLEDNFRLDFLDIKSPLRKELLRSFVIATARLYDLDQDYRYREELQKIITGLDSSWWWFYSSRFFTKNMRWEASQSGTRAANEALSRIVVGNNINNQPVGVDEVASEVIPDRGIYHVIKTPFLKKERWAVRNSFAGDNTDMKSYLLLLARIINTTEQRQEFQDLETLLYELKNWQGGAVEYHCIFRINRENDLIGFGLTEDFVNKTEEIIEGFQFVLEQRKRKLFFS